MALTDVGPVALRLANAKTALAEGRPARARMLATEVLQLVWENGYPDEWRKQADQIRADAEQAMAAGS